MSEKEPTPVFDERIGRKVHPIAALFPYIEPYEQFEELYLSIESHGQLHPVVLDGDVVIDGRNRIAACKEIKREPIVIQWSDMPESKRMTPGDYIIAQNVFRRDVPLDQKILICEQAMEFLNYEAARRQEQSRFQPGVCPNPTGRAGKQAHPKSGEPVPEKRDAKKEHARSTAGKLADMAGSSRYQAEQFLKVKHAVDAGALPPETLDQIKAGRLKVKDAVKQIPVKETPKAEEAPTTEHTPASQKRADAFSALDREVLPMLRGAFDVIRERQSGWCAAWVSEYRRRLRDELRCML